MDSRKYPGSNAAAAVHAREFFLEIFPTQESDQSATSVACRCRYFAGAYVFLLLQDKDDPASRGWYLDLPTKPGSKHCLLLWESRIPGTTCRVSLRKSLFGGKPLRLSRHRCAFTTATQGAFLLSKLSPEYIWVSGEPLHPALTKLQEAIHQKLTATARPCYYESAHQGDQPRYSESPRRDCGWILLYSAIRELDRGVTINFVASCTCERGRHTQDPPTH